MGNAYFGKDAALGLVAELFVEAHCGLPGVQDDLVKALLGGGFFGILYEYPSDAVALPMFFDGHLPQFDLA